MSSKINLKYGYSLTIRKDDTLTIVTTDAEGESIEIDGKNGNLMIASDMEAWLDSEYSSETLENLLYSAREFFKDWGVESEVAEAIIKELTPWFERHAISEEDAILQTISNIEEVIAFRRDAISRKSHNIEADNRLIEEAKNRINEASREAAKLGKEVAEYEKTVAILKAKLNKSDFISVEPCYTGGGIYVFTGQLADGDFFTADTSFFDVRVLNANPDEPTSIGEDGTVWERRIDSVEWQEEHLVKDLTPAEAVAFFRQMLKWVKENEPNGNYNMGDMEDITAELDTLKGDWR